jgi:hypothetical protein
MHPQIQHRALRHPDDGVIADPERRQGHAGIGRRIDPGIDGGGRARAAVKGADQAMAGIGYSPKSLPMTEWTLGYRYFVMNSPDFNTAAGKIKLDSPKAHTAEIGAKFKF